MGEVQVGEARGFETSTCLEWVPMRDERDDTSEYARLSGVHREGRARATGEDRGIDTGQKQSVTRGERSV